MDTVRKPAHLVKVGEVLADSLDHLELVIETSDSWDGGIMLSVFDLETNERHNWFYAAHDNVDVLA